MTERKKLIEVALPLDAINRESAERNPFVMAIQALCIYGGQDVL